MTMVPAELDETRTVKYRVLGVEPDIEVESFIRLVRGVTNGAIAAGQLAVLGSRNHGALMPPEYLVYQVPSAMRLKRVRYGSPIDILIDLEPVVKLIGDNGYVILTALIVKFAKDGVTIWEKIENARKTRSSRKQLSSIQGDDTPKMLAGPSNSEASAIAPLADVVEANGGDPGLVRSDGFEVIRSLNDPAVTKELAKYRVRTTITPPPAI